MRRSRPHPALVVASVVVAAAVPLAGCGGQDTQEYLDSATMTVGTALSEARTAEAVLEAHRDGKATTAYTRVVVTASDTGLAAAADSFGAQDPPAPGLDEQRRRLLSDIEAAEDAIADARIALGRGDEASVRAALGDLVAAGDTLERDLEALE